MPKKELSSNPPVTVTPTVNVNVSKVDLEHPVITINQPKITVCLVINLSTQDLPKNVNGELQLPQIEVVLMINLN